MAFEYLKERLEKNHFSVSVFNTKEEAADYLDQAIDNMTIGTGDSLSLKEMGIYPRLAAHNELYLWDEDAEESVYNQQMKDQMQTDIYLMSTNAIAEKNGEILSMDGYGNRCSSSLFGHKKVYMIAGKNKVSPDLEQAMWRLRNVVATKNAKRLNLHTPCAKEGKNCHDCFSPDRICNALVIHYKKIDSMDMEIILVNENLGY